MLWIWIFIHRWNPSRKIFILKKFNFAPRYCKNIQIMLFFCFFFFMKNYAKIRGLFFLDETTFWKCLIQGEALLRAERCLSNLVFISSRTLGLYCTTKRTVPTVFFTNSTAFSWFSPSTVYPLTERSWSPLLRPPSLAATPSGMIREM